jgi:hypothetical protein
MRDSIAFTGLVSGQDPYKLVMLLSERSVHNLRIHIREYRYLLSCRRQLIQLLHNL